MNQLVCLSDTPWLAAPSRAQQLLTRLRGVNILFFEPASENRAASFRQTGRRMRANVVVYTLPAPPEGQGSFPALRRRSQARLAAFMLDKLAKHRFREPLLWTTSPGDLFLTDALPHRGLVYDCSREWDELPLEWESELALRADVIFAASPGLASRLAPCCDNIAVIPNGVNYLLFSQAGLSVPPGLRRVEGPILCRVGEVAPELDLEPLCRAAAERPHWTFVLVGRVHPAAADLLTRLPNIRLTGAVSPAEVADYLSASRVCFDLTARGSRGSDILPGRIYEYLASGRPIVAMVEPDQVEPYPDVIYTAHTPAEFLSRCEHALQEDPDWVGGRRRGYARQSAWSVRADEVGRILETTGLF